MAEIKNSSNYNEPSDGKKKVIKTGKLKKQSFKQKIRDAFISDEVHDVKEYVVFSVIIPAIKETFRNLIVNTVDMSLFGKVRGNRRDTDQRGGSTYISYDRAYDDRSYQQRSAKPSKQGGAPIRVTELERVTFGDKNDALEVLNFLFESIDDYHVASVADFLGAADLPISPIHHKWGWYDLNGASVEEDPDGGYYIRLPRPGAI